MKYSPAKRVFVFSSTICCLMIYVKRGLWGGLIEHYYKPLHCSCVGHVITQTMSGVDPFLWSAASSCTGNSGSSYCRGNTAGPAPLGLSSGAINIAGHTTAEFPAQQVQLTQPCHDVQPTREVPVVDADSQAQAAVHLALQTSHGAMAGEVLRSDLQRPKDLFSSARLPVDARVTDKTKTKIWNQEFKDFGSPLDAFGSPLGQLWMDDINSPSRTWARMSLPHCLWSLLTKPRRLILLTLGFRPFTSLLVFILAIWGHYSTSS